MELIANVRLPVFDILWKGLYGDDTINAALYRELYGELHESMQLDAFEDMAPPSKTMASFNIPDNCCYLWGHENYGGNAYKACLEEDDYGFKRFDLAEEKIDNWKDSWECGKHVRAQFCNHKTDYCGKDSGEGGAGPARNPKVGSINAMSLVKLYQYNYETDVGVATLFKDSDCEGRSAALLSNVEGTVVGFDERDLIERNMYNWSPKSVQLPPGYTLELFGSNNIEGFVDRHSGKMENDGTIKCQKVYGKDAKSAKLYHHGKRSFFTAFPQ
jgi:hypothetical protein